MREREDANRTREAGHLDEIQGVVAIPLKLHRNGAVGFIDWLDPSHSIDMCDVEVHRVLPMMGCRKRDGRDVNTPVETNGSSKWFALRVGVALPNSATNLGVGGCARSAQYDCSNGTGTIANYVASHANGCAESNCEK